MQEVCLKTCYYLDNRECSGQCSKCAPFIIGFACLPPPLVKQNAQDSQENLDFLHPSLVGRVSRPLRSNESGEFEESEACLNAFSDSIRPETRSEAFEEESMIANEEGSEAAVATGLVIRRVSLIVYLFEEFRTFHADHPFLYALATRQGDILFTGTVASLE
uniref:Serpin domain-containing protein n=1 Tax=Acrobeloides nanus TaxID=290746 RepID=A0A914D744_9BILA